VTCPVPHHAHTRTHPGTPGVFADTGPETQAVATVRSGRVRASAGAAYVWARGAAPLV